MVILNLGTPQTNPNQILLYPYKGRREEIAVNDKAGYYSIKCRFPSVFANFIILVGVQ